MVATTVEDATSETCLQDAMQQLLNENKMLSIGEAEQVTGLSRSTIWKLEGKDAFPQRFRLSQIRIGYKLGEVMGWLDSRPRGPV